MANVNFEQTVTEYPVANLAALKAINTTSKDTGVCILVSSLGWYQFNKTSTETANDDTIVTPTTGGGRWYRMAGNIIKTPTGYAPSTLTDTTTLTNPAYSYYFISVNASDKQINLMPMNEDSSPSGGSIVFENSQGSNSSVAIYYNDGMSLIFAALYPGQLIVLTPIANASTNGAFVIQSVGTLNGSIDTTASAIWADPVPVTIKYNYDGYTATLGFTNTFAAANAAEKIFIDSTLTPFLRPPIQITIPISVQNNSVQGAGVLVLNTDGTMFIGNGDANGNFTASGTGGFYGFCMSYDVSL